MNVILTGRTGSGKSTVCVKLLDLLTSLEIKYGGVVSPQPEEAGEVGSDVVNLLTGERMPSSRHKKNSRFHGIEVGDYVVNSGALDFTIKALEDAGDSDVVFVDEVGPSELKNEDFMSALSKTMRSGKNTVCVVREKLLDEFTKKFVGVESKVYDVNEKTRKTLPVVIAASFQANNFHPKDRICGGQSARGRPLSEKKQSH